MFMRLIGLALGAALIPALAWADIGRVKKVDGDAYIERAGKKINAVSGLTLESGDVLVTGGTGRLSVTFIDNSRFSAGPNSRVSVDRFEFNTTTHAGAFESRLERGSLAIVSGQIAKARKDAMKLRTPTSILGVRGTRFIVEADR